jgi:pheromone shutdown protein TraB
MGNPMNIMRVLSLLFKSETGAVKTVLSRLLIFLVIFLVACVIAVMGLGFLLWSSYLYFSSILSPFLAALITGGGAILLGVILVLAAGLITGSIKRSKKKETFKDFLNSEDLGAASEFINEHPLESGLSAAVLGFLAGSSPDARRTIAELLVELRQSQRMN